MRCKVHTCFAACCYNIPLPIGFIEQHADKIVNPVILTTPIKGRDDLPDSEMVFTEMNISKNKCPFLKLNCKCNVYEDRPEICRRFGDASHPHLTCKFLK